MVSGIESKSVRSRVEAFIVSEAEGNVECASGDLWFECHKRLCKDEGCYCVDSSAELINLSAVQAVVGNQALSVGGVGLSDNFAGQ